jgi:hypothetical protein
MSDIDGMTEPLLKFDKVYEVLKLLKSIKPRIPRDKDRQSLARDEKTLGRALAVSFLRSAIGISTGRPVTTAAQTTTPPLSTTTGGEEFERHQANFHDELSFLLLEGVLAERPENEDSKDTELGRLYRSLLREFLKWPLAKLRTE